MKNNNFNYIHISNNYTIKSERNEKYIRIVDTQKEAIYIPKQIAKGQESELM